MPTSWAAIMALDNLLATMERRAAATPDTPCNPVKVSVKLAPILACTSDTRDTPRNGNGRIDERAAKMTANLADDPATETRRQRVLAMLAERPGIRYAALTDATADPEAVLLTLAIRDRATCELRIPREKWDGVLFLDLLERHSGTIH